ECELQDMTFPYGAAESKFMEAKNHKDEQQGSPVVFFDRPRCILCYRCVRVCGAGLGVRRSDTGMEIVRDGHRDKSGTNGDFLCIKGRYAFDFANNEERLRQPLIRKDGKLTPSTWEEAFQLVGKKFIEVRDKEGGAAIGVIGSTRTTNEESYLLSKFARVVLQTN